MRLDVERPGEVLRGVEAPTDGKAPQSALPDAEAERTTWLVGPLLVVIAVVALALRSIAAQQSLFGDELFTYFITSSHSLSGVVDRYELTENTPPVFYVLGWLSGKLGDPTVLIRLPSVLSGAAAVPILYLLGTRLKGPRAGLIAAALIAVLPFAVFYGSEARAYGLLLFLLPVSTLALLRALEDYRALWWVVYWLAASLAIYTHYIAGLVIALQAVWALLATPRFWRWRAVLAVNAAVLLTFAPWLGRLDNSTDGLKAFAVAHPLTAENVATDPLRVAFGHPFLSVEQVPGLISLFTVIAAAGIALVALIAVTVRRGPRTDEPLTGASLLSRNEVRLMALLVVGPPLITLAYSLEATSIFAARNLISTLPYVCVLAAVLITALPRRAAPVVATLTVLAALLGSVRMLADNARPDLHAAADLIETHSPPGTRVIEPMPFAVRPLSEDLAIYLDDRYPLSHDLVDLSAAPLGTGAVLRGKDVWVVVPNPGLRSWVDAWAQAVGAKLREAHTIQGLDDVYVALYRRSPARATASATGPRKARPLIARDVASEAGIARSVTTHGENCVFDYNRDGVKDLFLSTHDDGPWQLFRGKHDGTFVETNVGTFPTRDRHGCATGDFNGDGRPDIYASIGACQGTCTAPKELWIQTADGSFVDRASQFGLADPGGRGREPVTLDANKDERPDLFTGQAAGVDYSSPNRLWVNVAGRRFVNPPGLPTEEIDEQCNTAGNFDGDRYDELIVCGSEPHTFRVYDNSGGGKWSVANAKFGVPPYGRDAELADLNGDGRLDLVIATPGVLEVRLNEHGRFPTASYHLTLGDGRDLAVGDADGDGDQDIYVLQGGAWPDLLLMNRGSGTSYVSFPGLPQATTGEGDKVQAIPNWKGTSRAAFLVNNGAAYPQPGPRQLIELMPR
jgi:mannosyltransferase